MFYVFHLSFIFEKNIDDYFIKKLVHYNKKKVWEKNDVPLKRNKNARLKKKSNVESKLIFFGKKKISIFLKHIFYFSLLCSNHSKIGKIFKNIKHNNEHSIME